MKQPQLGFTPPDFSGQSQTLFFVDGNPGAILVTRHGKAFSRQELPLKSAAAALKWCQTHQTVFVFLPHSAALN